MVAFVAVERDHEHGEEDGRGGCEGSGDDPYLEGVQPFEVDRAGPAGCVEDEEERIDRRPAEDAGTRNQDGEALAQIRVLQELDAPEEH